jgi:hypothetical protein
MCARQTFTIVVSSPCMMQAQIIVAVVAARFGAGGVLSPLTLPPLEMVAARQSFHIRILQQGSG